MIKLYEMMIKLYEMMIKLDENYQYYKYIIGTKPQLGFSNIQGGPKVTTPFKIEITFFILFNL